MEQKSFTVPMAAMDALPVLFFAVAAGVLGMKLRAPLFFAGALVCFLAGAGKVLWKLLLALRAQDVRLLGAQLRYLMPIGFVLMLIGALRADRTLVRTLLQEAGRMPSILFFCTAVVGLIGMVVCAGRFDRRDVRGNWIEQTINAVAQACVMLGVLFL